MAAVQLRFHYYCRKTRFGENKMKNPEFQALSHPTLFSPNFVTQRQCQSLSQIDATLSFLYFI